MLHILLLLLVCQLVGEVVVRAAGIPFPGPVLGTMLLLLLLVLRRDIPARLERLADGILSHLSLLFVPAGVGVMLHLARIQTEWLPLLISLVVSTTLTLAVTALVFLGAMRWLRLHDTESGT
ncbi:CidA/LrgA family protein [Thioalkalicoccus limnaeus]|uniref:CidA/LrgA family protein n=1 Tax=Thioalkalicoccus limnaeus TaxID=120681 RepID=A0ABV4BGF9_9GAMM